jgi:tetratricopeptide (TPR) repeat protein
MIRSAALFFLILLLNTKLIGQTEEDYFKSADSKLVKRYNESLKLLKGENPDKGFKELKRLSDKNPDFFEAHLATGFHLKEREMYQQAIPFFSRAIKARPESALSYFYRGDCFLMLKKYAQAGGDYSSSIRYDSLFYAAYNNLAVVHILNQGRGKLLESELRLARDKIKQLEKLQNIMDPVMLMNTGLIHLHLFEFREAKEYFNKYLSFSDSLHGPARYDKALCHYYLKEYSEAKRNFFIAKASGYRKKDCEEFISFLGYIEEQLMQQKQE